MPQPIQLNLTCTDNHQKRRRAIDVAHTANSLKMLTQRIARASAMRSSATASRLPVTQRRGFMPPQYSDEKILNEKYPDGPTRLSPAQDPDMNGGYINPPAIKRQHRDPHADWWDPQERRNFGEPIHEDNDTLGMFSPWDYTWTTPGKGLIMLGTFVATTLSIIGVVSFVYPDKKAYPREFENGLERELGGPGAVRARKEGDEDP